MQKRRRCKPATPPREGSAQVAGGTRREGAQILKLVEGVEGAVTGPQGRRYGLRSDEGGLRIGVVLWLGP